MHTGNSIQINFRSVRHGLLCQMYFLVAGGCDRVRGVAVRKQRDHSRM